MPDTFARLLVRAWKYRLFNDRAEIAFVRSCLRPGQTALDIGAHKGAYTYWMARAVGARGKVVAFEPQPDYAKNAQALWAARPKSPVLVEHLALSDAPGTMTLFVPSWGPSPGASLERANVGAGAREERVSVERLDDYAQRTGLTGVRCIKCDVEGHEGAVFRGAQELLTCDRPTILFECEARMGGEERVHGVFSFLSSLGFRGWFWWRGGRIDAQRFRAAEHQQPGAREGYANNFVFEPEGASNP